MARIFPCDTTAESSLVNLMVVIPLCDQRPKTPVANFNLTN